MYAAISPRDVAAGLLRDEGTVEILDSNGVAMTTVSLERYLSRHPDTMVIEVRDGTHAAGVLANRVRMSRCLDMTLSLFDREVSLDTRIDLGQEGRR